VPDVDMNVTGIQVAMDGRFDVVFLPPAALIDGAAFFRPDGLNHTFTGIELLGSNPSGLSAACILSVSGYGRVG
jgi:hypothetical protein